MTDKIDWNDLVVEEAVLGLGSYGDVYRASWKTKDGLKNIVVKKFRDCIKESDILKEINNLSSVKHENIVTLFGITEGNDKRTVMLMEYADCGSLHDMLHNREIEQNNISFGHRINWMVQCAKGIEYLHEQCPKILHRDLKTKNLLLFNQFITLKICDFGTVKQLATKMTYSVGTAPYMAPEVSNIDSYTEKCDVYSFGITFWEVLSEKQPFYHLNNAVDVYILIQAIKGDRPLVSDIQSFKDSEQVVELIENCWKGEPNERPAMQKVIEELTSIYKKSEEKSKPLFNISYVVNRVDITHWPNVNFNEIILKELIGSGSFADVYRAKWKTKDGEKTIAARKIRFHHSSYKKLDRELKLLFSCHHENIVKMYGVSEGKDGIIYSLLEYAECGSLYDFLHSEEKKNIQISYLAKHSWMHQCAKGIAYLHERGIVHRNLKTRNILLFDNNRRLKLSGFGTVKEITSMMTVEIGTTHYMAPEVVNGHAYDSKCDVYSFGIIFWEVISRRRPYEELGHLPTLRILHFVLRGNRPPLEALDNNTNSKQIKTIIQACWHESPTNRPTMQRLSFTLSLDPNSFGDHLELIMQIEPLPDIDDTCFKEETDN